MIEPLGAGLPAATVCPIAAELEPYRMDVAAKDRVWRWQILMG